MKEALEGNAESLFCDEAVAEVLQKKQLIETENPRTITIKIEEA